MKTYSAINIGPIIDTLSMARKPRELWAASYMFSYLMRKIKKWLENNKYVIISPGEESENMIPGVGVYPDRIFFEGEIKSDEIKKYILDEYSTELGIGNLDRFFNIMTVSIERDSEKNVIKDLNEMLNCLELCNSAQDETVKNKVLELIQIRNNSPLFKIAFNDEKFNVMSLPEIATQELKYYNETSWYHIVNKMKARKDDDDDNFYSEIKSNFKDYFKTYHKYICIVQADGDNMGKIVSNLPIANVTKLSTRLMNFSLEVSKLIKDYGGMPIYAGGDDLLFFAPVVSFIEGKKTNIFELTDKIDEKYEEINKLIKEFKLSEDIKTAMSYGISISYSKYPLYEALRKADYLLFKKAKKTASKQSIAWDIQKHSGSTFSGLIPKKYNNLKKAFEELVLSSSVDLETTSLLAHKLRAAKGILSILWNKEYSIKESRLECFIKKAMDIDDKTYLEVKENTAKNNKDIKKITYIIKVIKLLLELYDTFEDSYKPGANGNTESCSNDITEKLKQIPIENFIYSILRTAKFINGEEDSSIPLNEYFKYSITLTPTGKFFFGSDMTFPVKWNENIKDKDNDEKKKISLLQNKKFNEKFSSYIIKSNYLPQQTSLLGMLRFYLLSNDSTYFDKSKMKIKANAADLIGEHSFNLNKDDDYGIIESISPCFLQVKIDEEEWQTLVPEGFDHGMTVDFSNNQETGTFNGRNIKIPKLDNFNYKDGFQKGFITTDGKQFFGYDEIFEEDARIGINRDLSHKADNLPQKVLDDAFYKQINYCFKNVKKDNEKITNKLKFRFVFTAILKKELDKNIYSTDLVSLGADNSTFLLDIKKIETDTLNKSDDSLKVTLLSDARITEDAVGKAVFSISETLPFRNILTDINTKDYGMFSDEKQRSPKTILYKRGSVFFFENKEDKKYFTAALENDIKFRIIGYNIYE